MPASELIVCVGDNCVDVTLSRQRDGERDGHMTAPTSPVHLAGGNAFNVAVALARMGRRAFYLGAIGDDPDAEVIVEAATQAGVDTSRVKRMPGSTGRTVV